MSNSFDDHIVDNEGNHADDCPGCQREHQVIEKKDVGRLEDVIGFFSDDKTQGSSIRRL